MQIVVPDGWSAGAASCSVALACGASGAVEFDVNVPPGIAAIRERIAVDVTVDGIRFGQQAEALISVPAT